LTQESLYFDDLAVGQEWVTAERTVTAADVSTFAELTGDRQPIHLDPEFARTTPFRRPIAHGLLGLSVGSGLLLKAPPLRIQALLGLRDWHFRLPVFPGDTVHVRQRVLAIEPRSRGRRGAVTWQVRLVNQDGRVAQEGVSVLLVEGRGALAERESAA
jgi:acyl dehydratase